MNATHTPETHRKQYLTNVTKVERHTHIGGRITMSRRAQNHKSASDSNPVENKSLERAEGAPLSAP